ncbi:MAG: TonB-dependent receptor, partial [Deltaproteobacteria bacterium]|nr:TonB-dependent receptor [Deltaproteobacteria bacterium]
MLAVAALLNWSLPVVMAEDLQDASASSPALEKVQHLNNMLVTAKNLTMGLEQNPSQTVIKVDDFKIVGGSSNLEDLLKSQAIFDFRGETDLVPDSDTMTMRGFSSGRFVAAIDGLTIQKTGGRKGTHIVDYSLLSTLPIDRIEITAGPHSALYDSKAIGGSVNIVTKTPQRRNTLKPAFTLSTGYGSYDKQDYLMSLEGAVDFVTYGIGLQKTSTDGYLRNSETDIETCTGNLGFILPHDGYLSLSASRSNIDREVSVNNLRTGGDYDSDYPRVEGSPFDAWQQPTWDKDAWSYRLNYQQDLPVGRLSAGVYRSNENRDRAYYDWVNSKDHSQGLKLSSMYTEWIQEGARLQDEYRWNDRHLTTVGIELARLYDGSDGDDERVNKKGSYLQHHWKIADALDLRLGLRHENVKIWVSNSGIPNRGDWIRREWNQLVPKSYLTWKLDGLAAGLRETSLSLGVSKIW